MKKLLMVVLAVLLVVSMTACAGLSMSPEDKVANYVEKNGDSLVKEFESSFTSAAGMDCESSIKAVDCGFVIDVKIAGLDNLDDSAKAQMQSYYDTLDGTWDSALDDMQSELPELEYFTINVCEEDGDIIAEITAGNK